MYLAASSYTYKIWEKNDRVNSFNLRVIMSSWVYYMVGFNAKIVS